MKIFTNREQRLKDLANGYLKHGRVRGINKRCPWLPCHKKNLQDCTFCVCPFYPCHDTDLGKWYHYQVKGVPGQVWDCSDCSLCHKKDLATELVQKIKRVDDHEANMQYFLEFKEKYQKSRVASVK